MKFLSTILILVLISIDYQTKALINTSLGMNEYLKVNEYLLFQKFYNKGIAFSLFDSSSIFINFIILLLILIIIIMLLRYFYIQFNSLNKIEVLSFCLIIGGAIGNVIDRIQNGYVLDFIYISFYQYYFPAVFNMADLFISSGVILLLITYYRNKDVHDKA